MNKDCPKATVIHDGTKSVTVRINPHLWRKMKQAERNMLRYYQAHRTCKRRHRARMWGMEFVKLSNKLIKEAQTSIV